MADNLMLLLHSEEKRAASVDVYRGSRLPHSGLPHQKTSFATSLSAGVPAFSTQQPINTELVIIRGSFGLLFTPRYHSGESLPRSNHMPGLLSINNKNRGKVERTSIICIYSKYYLNPSYLK